MRTLHLMVAGGLVSALVALSAPSRAAEVVVRERRAAVVEQPEEEVRDGVRLRFGFDLQGGLLDVAGVSGGAGGLDIRIGVQINHYFGIYYQQSPLIGFYTPAKGLSLGAAALDYNAGVASLILGHIFEVAAGPSFDVFAAASCKARTLSCPADSGNSIGLAGRAALLLGGLNGRGPRRSAFTIGANVHPTFLSAPAGGSATLMTATLTLGGEWY